MPLICVVASKYDRYIDGLTFLLDYSSTSWTKNSHTITTSAALDVLHRFNASFVHRWGCLDSVSAPKHSRNEWFQFNEAQLKPYGNKYLNGTTFWINEYMAVGHALMDIELISVLQLKLYKS